MAINKPFTINNGLSIGTPTGATALIDSSGNWVGPSTNLIGPSGPQGPQGPQGPAGIPGSDGPVGPRGPQGPTGPQGGVGPQGAQGVVGPRGPQGPQGASGGTGPQGASGGTGPQGPQGPTGPQGPSPAGAQGLSGPQGPQGPVGPQGPQGPNGPIGATGPRGPLGPLGPQGSTPPPGPNGVQGPAGPIGPQGPTGPQGPQGPVGPQGPQGPATILQSSVSSLGVGTPASGTVGEIRATNNITGFYSDIRLKDNIHTIIECRQLLEKLRGVYFNQNEFAEKFGYHDHSKQIGVIAQEVQDVVPEAVKLAPFDFQSGMVSRTGENYLTVNYLKLIPVLIEVIKIHQHEINIIKGQVK